MKYPGCYFHAENNLVTLAYPTTLIHPTSSPEFSVTISPASHSTKPFIFDETSAIFTSPDKRRKYTVVKKSIAPFIPTSKHQEFASTVRVKKLVPQARLPKRATEGAIGFDVCSTQTTIIPPNSTIAIHTGLAMSIPKPLYLRITS